jgi:hypothetical protein
MPLPALDNIENEKTIFKDLTHQLNNYNEIFNLNLYLQNSGIQERNRLSKTNETLKSKIMKLKQQYVLEEWKKSYMQLKINLVYYAIIIISVILIFVGLYLNKAVSLGVAIGVTIALSVFFILSVILIVKANSNRRNLFWDQFYWSPMK